MNQVLNDYYPSPPYWEWLVTSEKADPLEDLFESHCGGSQRSREAPWAVVNQLDMLVLGALPSEVYG